MTMMTIMMMVLLPVHDYNGVGGGSADVTGGNYGVGDGNDYGIGGHGDGDGNDDDDHAVVGDSGGIHGGCNGYRGGVGGGHVNKGDDKDRNGAHRKTVCLSEQIMSISLLN